MFITLRKDYFGQKAGARVDVDDAVAKTLIEQGVAEALQGDPLAPLFARAMDGMLANLTTGLNQSIDAALRQFAQETTKSRKNALPALFGPGGAGDPKRTFGHFLLAIRTGDQKALEAMGSEFVAWDGAASKSAPLGTQTGTTGGYLVPAEFHERLMMLATEQSIVRKRAFVIPQTHRTTQIPTLDHVTAPAAGDTAFLGGLVARWTEEAAALPQTNPTFKQVDLTNYELSGYVVVSNTLNADFPGLEAFLFQLFSRAVAWYEDYAFLRGNGVGKPLGVVNWAGLLAVTRSGASAFALADYAGMIARWLPNFDPRVSCWICHPTVMAKILQLADAEGHVLFIDNARQRPQMMLGGLPLEISEKLPALNTTGDVILGDFSQYVIGDRQQIEIAFSEHVNFLSNQSVWRFVARVAGMPWLRDKITLADATSTLSPFVGLS